MKNYKKYYIIPAPPEDVYLALTVPTTLLLWTGEEAIMSTVPESEFSLWDGSIEGKNLEFIEGKKIVQQWYFGDQEEPSIVTIILHADKEDSTSAELIFQTRLMMILLTAGTRRILGHFRSFTKGNKIRLIRVFIK